MPTWSSPVTSARRVTPIVFITRPARRQVSRGGTTRWFPLWSYFGALLSCNGGTTLLLQPARVTPFFERSLSRLTWETMRKRFAQERDESLRDDHRNSLWPADARAPSAHALRVSGPGDRSRVPAHHGCFGGALRVGMCAGAPASAVKNRVSSRLRGRHTSGLDNSCRGPQFAASDSEPLKAVSESD